MGRWILKWVFRAVLAFVFLALLLAGVVWLAFVPSPKEPGYAFVSAWGGFGAQPGQFNEPTGIAVTAAEVFVSDARNSRIQVFDHGGGFLRQFPKRGQASARLGRPMNLSIAGEELYVADYWHDRIQVYGLDGAYHRSIGGGGGDSPGRFREPGGVAVAPDGTVYVADFFNQRVQALGQDGAFIRQWGQTGEIGMGAGAFNYPTDVALGPKGSLYVADGYNDRIQVFAPDGTFLRKWGGPFGMNIFGPFNGWFATVTSLAVDASGNIFVADFYNHRIQKFSAEGRFLSSFGRKGKGPGEFRHAIAVAVAPSGLVFAVDFRNHRVLKWRPKPKPALHRQ